MHFVTGESHPKKGQEGGEARTFRSVAIFIDDGAEEKLNRVSQKGSLNEVRSSSKKTESEWISFLLSFTSFFLYILLVEEERDHALDDSGTEVVPKKEEGKNEEGLLLSR